MKQYEHKTGPSAKFIIENYQGWKILNSLGGNVDNVKFDEENLKKFFLKGLKNPSFLFELLIPKQSSIFINKEIIEFTDNFSGRWFSFHNLFKELNSEKKEILYLFRKYIYRQLKIVGCDKAYIFPDQGWGCKLIDRLNLRGKTFLKYLELGQYLEKDEILNVFLISDYIEGRRIINDNEIVHYFIDDFRDMI